jgi:uncharacterized phage protein gp47/JayE
MQLSLQTFSTYVQQFAATAQAEASVDLDFTVGSIMRALAEANSAQALWLQWIAFQVLQTTRLATSTGIDVDSFIKDFALTRLPGVSATGQVTFGRFTAVTSALVPIGAQVKTTDGTQTFSVIADTTQPGWNAAQNGYLMAAGVYNVTATIQAVNAGTVGNVLPGTVSQLASAIPGVDTVTNALAFTNGVDPETDQAVRARFLLYIAGLSKATEAAVGSAIAGVQQGLSYAIVENNPLPGSFIVVIDDGSGAPPAALLNNVFTAVNLVRPVGSSFSVIAPNVTRVTVQCTLAVGPGVSKTNLIGPVETAITDYINGLPVGASLAYTRLAQIIYDVAPTQITNVTGLAVNGGTADINPGVAGAVKTASVVAS